MLWLFLMTLFCFTVLAFQHLRLLRQVRRIYCDLFEVNKGDFNQRIRLQTRYRTVAQLVKECNIFINKFQANMEHMNYLDKSRRQLTANMSHDLKTPLTSLLGYVQAIREDPSLTEEERQTFLKITHQKGQKLQSLLNDFFDLAKLESEDSLFDFKKTDVVRVIKELIAGLYQDLKKANMEPVLEIPETPVMVWADRKSVERILSNLLSNGIDYGKHGGVLGVSINKEVKLTWVEVWDRGRGINQEDLPYIFNRLYTGEHSRNKNFQGNGIGLTISKRLIEKHNGSINVESHPFERTSFSFSLPSAKQ
ncbi:sensor histidine kinase [Salicibibacter cibarius]|nr:HAMP domain-containing sensor histidine kinase [Salicibibacter cibarius]